MIETIQVGQPTIITNDEYAASLRKTFARPRVRFQWDGAEQTLYVHVPTGITRDYDRAFRSCTALHVIMSKDAWFTPVPKQSYCLCIIDEQPEPLLLGFTAYDWHGGTAPQIGKAGQRAKAVIRVPERDGRTKILTRAVPLLVGAREK